MNRFWDKVQRTDGCWNWTGAKLPKGYGRFYYEGRRRYAHHVALLLDGQDVPFGAIVRHDCDNPSCVNPAHLIVGTQAENVEDCISKGRHVAPPVLRGEKNGRAKLSDAETAEIAASVGNGAEVARQFGVSKERVYQIRGGG